MIIIICFNTVIWFQVFFTNTNNFQTYLFKDGTLISTTTPGQSGHGSHGKKRRLLHTSQSSKTGVTSLDAV